METVAQPFPVASPSDLHDPAPPPIDYSQEIRFAVVMYGGVSLAIYINGVAQELFNLVRATAPETANEPTLDSSQRVYRKLGQIMAHNQPTGYSDSQQIPASAPIQTRFVVDILSGTSAGGINAVYLAKALANDQNFGKLGNLWLEEGDISKLVNDASSVAGLNLRPQMPPRSLLNSQRMYWKLLEALDEMDKSNTSGRSLVDNLDLYTTATDIDGQVISLPLSDKTVKERRHRAVFHFRHSRDEGSDFGRDNNPFLAFVARCTSAFPIAFEPMRLKYIDEVTDAFEGYNQSSHQGWREFYRSYLPLPRDPTDPTIEMLAKRFGQTDFSDGGVLDNFPFGYVIDTMPLRDAEWPVDRKLVYIEPAPTHPNGKPDPELAPSFVANGWSALSTLPRYETIREDLQRVIARNQLIVRVKRIIEGLEQDADARYSGVWPPPPKPGEWSKLTLTKMLREKGLAWSGYQHLRVAEVTNDLARLIARAGGIDEDTAEFKAIRETVRCWRRYTYEREGAASDNLNQPDGESSTVPKARMSSENDFLSAFDYLWRLRRLKFVFARIDEIICLDLYQTGDPAAPQNQRWEIIQGFARHKPGEQIDVPSDQDQLDQFRNKLRQIKAELRSIYVDMRKQRRLIWREARTSNHNRSAQAQAAAQGKDYMDLGEAIEKLDTSREELRGLLEPSPEQQKAWPADVYTKANARGTSELSAVIEGQIEHFYEQKKDKFESFANNVAKILGAIFTNAGDRYTQVLDRDRDTLLAGTAGPGETMALIVAWHYFYHFDDYDMITYPIIYATQVGEELDMIDIFRISPEDAGSLRPSTPANPKLAGTLLQNFGAFFKRGFRENDIVWGRLDGTERIITALLPDPHDKAIRDQLIEEAQVAIIVDDVLAKNASYQQKKAIENFLKNTNTVAGSPLNGPFAVGYAELLKGIEGSLRPPAPPVPTNRLVRWINKAARARSNQSPAPLTLASALYLWSENELEYFKRTHEKTDRKLDAADTIRTAARASKVFGQMLEGYSKQQRLLANPALWVTRLARIFWGVVEVAVPGSLANLVFYYWLKLLYLFELLMIVLGALLVNQTIQQFGMVAFGITAASHLAAIWLADLMSATTSALRFLKRVAIVLGVLLTIFGVALVAATLGVSWLQTTIKSLVEPSETLYNASGQLSLQWILSIAARPLLLLLILAILLKTLWSEWRTTGS